VGLRDSRPLEMDAGGGGSVESCVCVAIGTEFRAACWDTKTARALLVPLVALDDVEEATSHDGAAVDFPRHVGDALRGAVAFGGDASAKHLQGWLRPDSEARHLGILPQGVSVGERATAAASAVVTTSSAEGAALVVSPVRLLGLRREDGDVLKSEARQCGVTLSPVDTVQGARGPQCRGIQVCIEFFQRGCDGSAQVLVAAPEDLVALLLAEIRRRCVMLRKQAFHEMALAVPVWWDLARREAATDACIRSGARLRHMASRTLCIAVGALVRMAGECDDRKAGEHAEVASVGSTEQVEQKVNPNMRMLVVDVDVDSAGAALLEAVKPCTGCSTKRWAMRSARPLTTKWLHAAATASWRSLAIGGEPRCAVDCEAARANGNVEDSGGGSATGRLSTLGGWLGTEAESSDPRTLDRLEASVRRALLACKASSAQPAVALVLAPDGTDELDRLLTVLGHCLPGVIAIPVLPADAAIGLAHLVGAWSDMLEYGDELRYFETLPSAIGLLIQPSPSLGAMDDHSLAVDVLFERNLALPVDTTRTFNRGDARSCADLLIVQQDFSGGAWRPCEFLESALTSADAVEDEECDSVTYTFRLDAAGNFTIHVDTSGESPDIVRKATWRRWIRTVAIALFLLLASFASLYCQRVEQGSGRSDSVFRTELEDFLREHSPSNLGDIEGWLRQYRGREGVLMRRLEKTHNAKFPDVSSKEF